MFVLLSSSSITPVTSLLFSIISHLPIFGVQISGDAAQMGGWQSQYSDIKSSSHWANMKIYFNTGGQTQTRLDIFFIDVYFLCDFVSDVRTERSNYGQSCVTHCHTCRVTEASCHDKNVTHVNLWRLVRENGIRIHPALAELSDTLAPGLGPPATDQQIRSCEPMLQLGLPVHLS